MSMSFPQIPENIYRPKLNEVIIDLLESIALEETSLSNLLNAEANRIQAFVGKNKDFPSGPSNEIIVLFGKTSSNLLDNFIMKEWILYKKLLSTLDVLHKVMLCDSESYE